MCSYNTPKKSIKMWIASVTQELKATTRTWRESGDWVALHNIINRGSTHMSNKGINSRSYKKASGIISWVQDW